MSIFLTALPLYICARNADKRRRIESAIDNRRQIDQQIRKKRLAKRVISELESRQLSDNLATSELIELCKCAKDIFAKEAVEIRIEAPIVIFGDLHGQFTDLIRWLDFVGRPCHSRMLFLGDYVDRGKSSIEVMSLLFAYKVLYPTDVYLLRGNHECESINHSYGFYEECRRRRSKSVYDAFQNAFDQLPLCASISNRILCMHGGIGNGIDSWSTIEKLDKPIKETDDATIQNDLLWADPDDEPHSELFPANTERGTSCTFGKEEIDGICKRLDIDMIVRAHEMVDKGHKFMHNNRVCTVFSAPDYGGKMNYGSVMIVNKELGISFKTLVPCQLDNDYTTILSTSTSESESS